MLIDVSATTIGGADGNAITYHSHGPLYLSKLYYNHECYTLFPQARARRSITISDQYIISHTRTHVWCSEQVHHWRQLPRPDCHGGRCKSVQYGREL